jgi:hypothetical protein
LLNLFRKSPGVAVSLNAKRPRYHKRVIRRWIVKHLLVPKRMCPVFRKRAAVEGGKVFWFGGVCNGSMYHAGV